MHEQDVLQLKEKLKAEANKKFPDDKARQDAYIFGTLRRLGWKPKER